MTTTMPMPELAPDPRRRRLMGVALCAPAAATGALLATTLPPAPAAPLPLPTPVQAPTVRPQGYHRSAHIDTYYASLRY